MSSPKNPSAAGPADGAAEKKNARVERRRDFHILVVDRDDARRSDILDQLISLGFGSVQVAAAPGSAASFADAQPPHFAFVSYEPAMEARETIQKLRAVSRETQIILHVGESEAIRVRAARQLVKELGLWDLFLYPSMTNDRRDALELVADRAGDRLYFQFETEHFKEKWQKLAPTSHGDPRTVRERVLRSIGDFARSRDLETILNVSTRSLAHAAGEHPVLYFRWVPIRSSFVLTHSAGDVDSRSKGLGFAVADVQMLRDLAQVATLRSFIDDVFHTKEYTALLHGTPEEPKGLFVLLKGELDVVAREETEAISFLFDLTWSRLEALRDRHVLERVDRATGFPNQQALQENLDYECIRARRLKHPLSVATFAIADEKRAPVDAQLGATYEAVLKVMGGVLKRALRGTDFVARSENGRFVILMPHTSVSEAVGVTDRMCRLLERVQLPALESVGLQGRIRACAGVVEYPRLASGADSMLQAAEDALLAAQAAPDGVHVMVFEVREGFVPDFDPVSVERAIELSSSVLPLRDRERDES